MSGQNYQANHAQSDEAKVTPKLVHHTFGGPFYPEFKDTEYAAEWFKEFAGAKDCKETELFALTGMTREKLASGQMRLTEVK
ncbi:MAG: hypothetical protein ACRERU_06075 [Methylococcales bacterium]